MAFRDREFLHRPSLDRMDRSKRINPAVAEPSPVLPAPTCAPWPRREGIPIRSTKIWDEEPEVATLMFDCVERPVLDVWDEYDTLFYNAWLTVDIQPTQVACLPTLQRMGIAD